MFSLEIIVLCSALAIALLVLTAIAITIAAICLINCGVRIIKRAYSRHFEKNAK